MTLTVGVYITDICVLVPHQGQGHYLAKLLKHFSFLHFVFTIFIMIMVSSILHLVPQTIMKMEVIITEQGKY